MMRFQTKENSAAKVMGSVNEFASSVTKSLGQGESKTIVKNNIGMWDGQLKICLYSFRFRLNVKFPHICR